MFPFSIFHILSARLGDSCFFSGPYKFNLLLSLLFAFSSDVEVHSSLLRSNYYFWCIIFLQIRWLTLVDGEAIFLRNLVCPYEAWFVIVKLVCLFVSAKFI